MEMVIRMSNDGYNGAFKKQKSHKPMFIAFKIFGI